MKMRDAGRQLNDIANQLAVETVRLDDRDLSIIDAAAKHLDPTDEQLALDAGRFVVEFFGQSGDTVALDEAAARAAYLYEQRITHSILAWDRVILGYFAGRLGSDWAKGDS